MEYNNEYIELLDLFARVVESVKGEKVPPGMGWITETQPLSVKLFFHLGSIFYLSKGTSLTNLSGAQIGYVDNPSITVLARTAFEAYLAFYYIFVDPPTLEEKHFRHSVWDLGGLLDRQSFQPVEEENKRKMAEEKLFIAQLTEGIKQDPHFSRLSDPRRREALKGKWRLNHSWADLAHFAGFDREYFKSIYRYLSAYSHTGNLSVFQLAQIPDSRTQTEFAETWLGLGLVIMGHFILAYTSIFPNAGSVLQAFPEAAKTAETWNTIGRALKHD